MAANQSSPGVVIQERDLTTITTLSTANVGVIAAPFESGPVEEIVEIATERELAERFGKPNDNNFEYWYTAAQFLSYGGVLKTIRIAADTLKNAVNTGTAPLIKNLQDYETSYEAANNTWTWAAMTPGSKGNSIGVFVTDAGADQIAVIPAPSSGNEFEFVADEAVSAASGAAGKVFKYSIVLTVDTIVGDFTPGVSTTVNIGGSEEAVTVLAWDPANKKLEIALPGGGVTGILADGQAITQGTNTAAIDTTIERRLYVALNKDSIAFAATDSVNDTNTNAAVISSVRDEYSEREYLPGVKWINVAPRPETSLYANNAGGHRDELHILVLDIDGKITGTTGAILERFVGVSKASDAKTSVGETNYYVNVLKQKSQYLFWGEHETGVFNATASASDGNWGQTANSRQFNLLRSTTGSTDYPAGRTTVGSKNNATYYYRLINGADYTGVKLAIEQSSGGGPAEAQYNMFAFDAVDDEIVVSNGVCGNNDAVTISAWVKISSSTPAEGLIYAENDGTSRAGVIFRLSATNRKKLLIGGRQSSNGTFYNSETSTDVLTDDTLHFVTGVINTTANNHKIYVDGALVLNESSIGWTSDIVCNGLSLNAKIGEYFSNNLRGGGERAQRRKEKVAVNHEEGKKVTNGGKIPYYETLPSSLTSGCVMAIEMSSRDNTLNDLSGNSNNGTANGGVTDNGSLQTFAAYT